jgi:predicted secreted hydrolase
MTFTSPVTFPRDEGYHPEATYEWWYLNSHLTSKEGRNYSLVECFFPSHLLSMLADTTSGKLLYNIGTQHLDFSASTSLLNVKYGRSWWKQTSDNPLGYTMHVDTGDFSADLVMEALKKPMLIDGTGQIREGLLGRSYYYARPRLRIEGSLEIEKRKIDVNGIAWIDRQWGEWEWSGLGTWRWFSIQLENNVDILAIQITNPLTSGVNSESFTISDETGKTKVLRKFTVKELGKWCSPDSKQVYGNEWTINVPEHCEFHVKSVFAEQETMKGLWEGVCTVEGTYYGKRVVGKAFTEQSHGRIYGLKRKALYLPIGVVNYFLRRTLSTNTNLVDRAVEVLHAD